MPQTTEAEDVSTEASDLADTTPSDEHAERMEKLREIIEIAQEAALDLLRARHGNL